MAKKEKINPFKFTINDGEYAGEQYTLEATRATVKFAESKGFIVSDVGSFPVTQLPDLFFYLFRANHKNVARDKTDKILFDEFAPVPKEYITRWFELYAEPMTALIATEETEEEARKNVRVTVEM